MTAFQAESIGLIAMSLAVIISLKTSPIRDWRRPMGWAIAIACALAPVFFVFFGKR